MICVPWWQFPVQIPSPWKKTNISLARRPLAGDTSSQPVEEGEEGVEEAVHHRQVGVIEADRSGRYYQVQDTQQSVERMIEYVEHPVGLILEQLVLEDITVHSAPVEESDE